jgi:hypothetical protein
VLWPDVRAGLRPPWLNKKLQTSPDGVDDPLHTLGPSNCIGLLILIRLLDFESKMPSSSSIVGRRQSANAPVRKLLQYWSP